MGVKEKLTEEIRLTILQFLKADPGYSINHRIMAMMLDENRAYSLTEDQVKTHFQWLEEQDCVTIETVGAFTSARLTDTGLAAASNRKHIPGIARPRPSAL